MKALIMLFAVVIIVLAVLLFVVCRRYTLLAEDYILLADTHNALIQELIEKEVIDAQDISANPGAHSPARQRGPQGGGQKDRPGVHHT